MANKDKLLHDAESKEKCLFFAKVLKEKLFALQFINLVVRRVAILCCFYFCSSFCWGQSGPLRFRNPFLSAPSDTLFLKTDNYVPDSTVVSLSGLQFKVKIPSSEKTLFMAVSNSGAILAFEDSLFLKPVKLEKRGGFPFSAIKANNHFMLQYTKRPGSGDYLAFRLISLPELRILDEVLICSQHQEAILDFEFCFGWISQE
jgi:hypothetical protein